MCKTCTKCAVEKPLSEFNRNKYSKDGLSYWCKYCISSVGKAAYEANRLEKLRKQKEYYARNPEAKQAILDKSKAKRAEYNKSYRERNKDRLVSYLKEYQAANREALAKKRKIYYVENKDRVAAWSKDYYAKNKALLSSKNKAYRAKNLEKLSAYDKAKRAANKDRYSKLVKDYYSRNIGRFRAYNRRRKLAKIQAVPAWSNAKKIEAIYASCARISKCLGTTFHVDHIVPLQSPLVCGLHVFENLQILSAQANLTKSNKFEV
jgi:hypothetical protein